MKTINVTAGQRNEVVVEPTSGAQTVQVGSSAFGGVLPELVLTITRPGLNAFNVGGLEPRRTLYLNGLRQRIGIDFTINLPYIHWISSVPLDPTDLLILTF